MVRRSTKHLACPSCQADLRLDAWEVDGDHVMEGLLVCSGDVCGSWYPLTRGVPRLLPRSLREDRTAAFVATHRERLQAAGIRVEDADGGGPDALHDLKKHTIENFGFEWQHYDRFGWEGDVFDLEWTRKGFLTRTLFEPGELAGKLVLDAGCGNGRYSHVAAESGATIIGVDLGDAVEAAFRNTRDNPAITIVQGDIFQLPFRPRTFDLGFSIGVLMHTGDARRATLGLCELIRPGGTFTAHVYEKGNAVYEWADAAIRERTVRWPIPRLEQLAAGMHRGARVLQRLRLHRAVNRRLLRLDADPHCLFDWYAAPIATHHTHDEVESWFHAIGWKLVAGNRPPPAAGLLDRLLPPAGSVTVRARRPDSAPLP